MSGACKIRWCTLPAGPLVSVGEDIGDGCWSVLICRACTLALGLSEGDVLPDLLVVEQGIRARREAGGGVV